MPAKGSVLVVPGVTAPPSPDGAAGSAASRKRIAPACRPSEMPGAEDRAPPFGRSAEVSGRPP